MWRELIGRCNPEWGVTAPARGDEISGIETALSVRLPKDLVALLNETDGVTGRHGQGLVWPARQIRDDNLLFRSNPDFPELYTPFDSLLFFGEDGGGDQFAFVILAGQVQNPDVFRWDHENDSRYWVAPSLARFLEWAASEPNVG